MLNNAKSNNKVDKRIEKILDIINKFDDYYTSSSCSGRIVLIELPVIGDKRRAKFLGKWHRKINIDELEISFTKAKNGLIWVLAQSPIIHVSANSNLSGDKLLKIALSCGFKNSGFKTLYPKKIVEICSTERLDCPIGNNGSLFCSKEYLSLIVEIANEIIIRSNIKLIRLEKHLIKSLNCINYSV